MAVPTSPHEAIPTSPPDSPDSPLSSLSATPSVSPSFLASITKPSAASTPSTHINAPTPTPAAPTAPTNTRRSSRVAKQTAKVATLDSVKEGKVQKLPVAAKKRAQSTKPEASSGPPSLATTDKSAAAKKSTLSTQLEVSSDPASPVNTSRPVTEKKRSRSSQDDADVDNTNSSLEPPKKKYYLKFDLSRTPSPNGKPPNSKSANSKVPQAESLTFPDSQNGTDKETRVFLPDTKKGESSKKLPSTSSTFNKKDRSSKKPALTNDTSKKNLPDVQNNETTVLKTSAKNNLTSKKLAATDDTPPKDLKIPLNNTNIPVAKSAPPKKARKVAVPKARKAPTKTKVQPVPAPQPLTAEQIAERTEMTTFYFAYGKEASIQYLERKFPGCKVRLYGVAKISDFKFVLHSDGYAKIHSQEGSEVYGALWEIPEFIRATMEAKAKKHGMKFLEVPGVQLMTKDPNNEASDFNAKLIPFGQPSSAWMGVGELDGKEEMGKQALKESPYKHRLLNEAILQLRSEGVPFDYVMENVRPWVPMPASPFESGYWNSGKPAKA